MLPLKELTLFRASKYKKMFILLRVPPWNSCLNGHWHFYRINISSQDLSFHVHVRPSVYPTVRACPRDISWNSLYRRPILDFGYCRCLRLSVCPSVRVCFSHKLGRVITWDPVKIWSPNWTLAAIHMKSTYMCSQTTVRNNKIQSFSDHLDRFNGPQLAEVHRAWPQAD